MLETAYLVDREIHLDGRGLLLIPSYFCWGAPVTLVDVARSTPLLVYPVEHDLAVTPGPLSALIGRTRSELLHLLAGAHLTTGELARRLDVTAGNISQHTRVLREAGLITTCRHANLVVHTAAPLGRRLLDR
ncbi:ArsR/SmtB family transcription factor [Lentzea tibetensis]|uniref:ArsR/SmtB family transcription factor n=1 Tax=Lentzea tibetensis TaxID=2591470 RepID=UPI001C999F90|nr:ArsR family transcriptional regulator [Lentzea tibetensis]